MSLSEKTRGVFVTQMITNVYKAFNINIFERHESHLTKVTSLPSTQSPSFKLLLLHTEIYVRGFQQSTVGQSALTVHHYNIIRGCTVAVNYTLV